MFRAEWGQCCSIQMYEVLIKIQKLSNCVRSHFSEPRPTSTAKEGFSLKMSNKLNQCLLLKFRINFLNDKNTSLLTLKN